MSLIDTHHHFVPEFYAQAVEDAGGDPSGWPTPSWSAEGDIAFTDKIGVTKAILSLTAPGAVIAPTTEKRRALARKANDDGAFSHLPCLLDTEGALVEIKYALDVLKAEGELNFRKAVVFIHPTHPADTTRVNPLLPQPAIDYPHETTRTAVDMIITNTKRSYPDCKVILSHAGGTLPFLITRICAVSKEAAATARIYGKSSEEIMEDFRSFYFDLALSSSEAVLKLVLEVIPHDHITYGSDFPYASPDKSLGFKQILDGFPLDPELRDKIYFGNANNLFNKP
ncbi:amidohydrolase family protein [Aspergillus neoniger CBS 115656]|uniref:6-methylsalicylate decarboxylase n=1 Tax=Aspergillus neoniger (strain CBS 115656) TaxID=1448310 RepID=A0A318YJI0_ASPNB|nr:amidohydrolase family protein [Aspergillus neoniger CBS 115656]PYH28448.1 amidohydrolase family protein [Aspergillus neoniger CBS 115656]